MTDTKAQNYHGKMMNIKGRPASMIVGDVSTWHDGHKYARHAAAEIANAADAHISAQSARIDALTRERDSWSKAVGTLLAAVPVNEIVGAGGSVNDLAAWMKERHSDAKRIDALEAALVKADELADAAAHIRHWHDAMRDNSGMVVSAEHVRILWKVLAAYNEAKNARTALNDKTPTDTGPAGEEVNGISLD